MTCPYLAYRESGDGRTFDVARAYCTATDAFVQPMRADICSDRYDLDHATDCEIYREHEAGTEDGSGDGTPEPTTGSHTEPESAPEHRDGGESP